MLTDADLRAARRGDRDAVASIYLAYVPALTRYFVSSTGDRYAAEELVSKVFEQAIRALPAFRGPVEALGGWLFQIARHDLLEWARLPRQRAEPLDDRLEEVTRADTSYERQELAANRVDGKRAIAMLRKLSPGQQQVLTLRLVGLSTVEVAKIMDKTVGEVKALQHRALASLAAMNAAPASDQARVPVPVVVSGLDMLMGLQEGLNEAVAVDTTDQREEASQPRRSTADILADMADIRERMRGVSGVDEEVDRIRESPRG